MSRFCVLLCCFFVSCLPIDQSWPIDFHNSSNQEIYFYINCYEAGGNTHPSYEALSDEKPHLLRCPSYEKISIDYGPNVFKSDETILHTYAFSADTLEKYSWQEIIETQNYWKGEVVYKFRLTVQFPEVFEYMGN